MNAQASRMVRMFQHNDEGKVGVMFLMFAFFVTLAFDGGSSWVGFIQQNHQAGQHCRCHRLGLDDTTRSVNRYCDSFDNRTIFMQCV